MCIPSSIVILVCYVFSFSSIFVYGIGAKTTPLDHKAQAHDKTGQFQSIKTPQRLPSLMTNRITPLLAFWVVKISHEQDRISEKTEEKRKKKQQWLLTSSVKLQQRRELKKNHTE